MIGPWRHHLCIYKSLIRENCLLTAVILSKIIFSEPNSFMHMFNVSTLYKQSIKLFHQKLYRSWSAHEGTIDAYTNALLGKNCLSSHSCHFGKKYVFFWTKLLHAYVQCVYVVSATYQIAPSKAVVGVDRPMKALSMYIQKPYMRITV